MRKVFVLFMLVVAFCTMATAQRKERKVIQFSGYTVTADSLIGVPFVHITIASKGQVSMSGPDGFFSFVAQEGDTLVFTCIGYQWAYYIIPAIETDKVSVFQLMARKEEYLPPTVIYPWGPKENFPAAFLNTHPPDDGAEIARKNLERKTLAELGERLEKDGNEATNLALRNQSMKKYYYGQAPPQNVFNPLAWAQFIQAWKRGDFKKKEKVSTGREEEEK